MMQTYDVCHEEFSNTRYEGHTYYERWLPTFLLSFGIYAGLFGISSYYSSTVFSRISKIPVWVNCHFGGGRRVSKISVWEKCHFGVENTVFEIPAWEKCHFVGKKSFWNSCDWKVPFLLEKLGFWERSLHLWPAVMIHSRKWRAGAYFLRDPGSFSSPV